MLTVNIQMNGTPFCLFLKLNLQFMVKLPLLPMRKLETLFTMDPNRMMILLLLPRPLGGLYISLAAGHPMIHHLDCKPHADARRPNRE